MKKNFSTSQQLLKNVITRQSGNWRKGIKELIQNSIDGASRLGIEPWIAIQTEETEAGSKLIYVDNGGGLGETVEEIEKRFAVFGDSEKAGKDKFLGEFGMGRGQTISMIYDPEQKKLDGSIEVVSIGKKHFRLHSFRIDDELSFEIDDISEGYKEAGTRWEIISNTKRFTDRDVRNYVERNVVLPFPILVNGIHVVNKPDGKEYETKEARIHIKSSGDGFELYERGLKVRDYGLFKGFSGVIVSKVPLNLNFARNDVMDDSRWKKIQDNVKKYCLEWFDDAQPGWVITEMKGIGLMNEMIKDPKTIRKYGDLPIIVMANGKKASVKELMAGDVYGATFGDRMADDFIQAGKLVVDRDRDTFPLIQELLESNGKKVIPMEDASYKASSYIKSVVPDAEDRVALKLLNDWLDSTREVKLATTSLKSLQGWTDGRSYVCIEVDVWKRWLPYLEKGFDKFLLKAIPLLAHEFAHDSDNLNTDIHGPGFDENLNKIMVRFIDKVAEMGR